MRWRSTVTAEVFFNVEAQIAVELKTEYFKHLPGLMGKTLGSALFEETAETDNLTTELSSKIKHLKVFDSVYPEGI